MDVVECGEGSCRRGGSLGSGLVVLIRAGSGSTVERKCWCFSVAIRRETMLINKQQPLKKDRKERTREEGTKLI